MNENRPNIVVHNDGDGEHLRIYINDHLHYYQLVNTVRGLSNRRWVPGTPGYWQIPFNAFDELTTDLSDLPFPCPMEISDSALAIFTQWKDTIERRLQLKQPLPLDFKLPLESCFKPDVSFPNYQLTGGNFLYRSKRAILGDVVGSGKTVQAIIATSLGFANNRYAKVVVIMPRENLRRKWGDEIEKFTYWRQYQVAGNPAQRRATYQKFAADRDPCYLCVMYSTIRNDAGALAEALRGQAYAIIADEIQHCKHYTSLQSRATRLLAKDAAHLYALSATYMEGKLEELHSVMRVVNTRVFGTWTGFTGRYIRVNFFRWEYVRIPEVKRKVEPYILRRQVDDLDHLDFLPEEVFVDYWITLGKNQRELYQRVLEEEKLRTMALGSRGQQIAVEMIRERQVCCFPEIVDPEITERPKLDELIRIIDEDIEPDAKIVVFSFFQPSVEILTRELNRYWGTIGIHGGMDMDRVAVKKRFTEDPSVRILVTSDVFREGDDLVAARYVVHFDLLWNPAQMDQRKGRLTRFSQKAKQVVIISLITRNTVEQYMFDHILAPKRALMHDVLDNGRVSSKMRQEAREVIMQQYRG